mmetsp:Transcript_4597/g.14576  ORF Transcript_4597/g.14576 Transcript_4597/m.14576 type:complete len:219 (-) Transcript_4597:92-748(-)
MRSQVRTLLALMAVVLAVSGEARRRKQELQRVQECDTHADCSGSDVCSPNSVCVSPKSAQACTTAYPCDASDTLLKCQGHDECVDGLFCSSTKGLSYKTCQASRSCSKPKSYNGASPACVLCDTWLSAARRGSAAMVGTECDSDIGQIACPDHLVPSPVSDCAARYPFEPTMFCAAVMSPGCVCPLDQLLKVEGNEAICVCQDGKPVENKFEVCRSGA